MSNIGKLGVLEEFFVQRLWFLNVGQDRRIIGCSIKVEPTGYLAVLKAITPAGRQVTFVGSKTLDGVRRHLEDPQKLGKQVWRDDLFGFDKK